MDKKTLKNVCVGLILITLFSLVFVSLPTYRVMATTTISSINPSSGFVGDTVTVNGTIDTPNGFFTIKWDNSANVTTGQASGFNVTASFVVPQTVGAPSGRNVTLELIDDAAATVAPPNNFTLYTKLHMNVQTPVAPIQLQEGSTVPIAVNVTGGETNTVYAANITVKDPANQTYFTVVSLSNTTTTGYGEASKAYPTSFSASAHTNTTGKFIVAFNNTVATEFFVGLTDKSEYRRNETVQVQATGYKPSETVTVNIMFGASSVADFPKSVNATASRVVTLPWKIPLNATPGTYSLSLTNSTSTGTVKTPQDIQNFEVLGAMCDIQTRNLAGESVAGALVEVNNATSPNAFVTRGSTNATGWIRFNLDTGNYSFTAFVQNVDVGNIFKNLTGDTELILQLRLVNIVVTVETEAGGVPFIDITVRYNYTMQNNNVTSGTVSAQTNLTGITTIRNLFTNTTYKVEATRYGTLFNRTMLTVEFSPSSPLNLDLTLPTYTLNVHAINSQNKSADGMQIKVYEWSSGVTTPISSSQTDSSGDASFLLPFGRYRLRVFKGDALLNESVVNLFEDPLNFALHLITANVKVTVSAFDYFGQPIANAELKIERKVNQEYVLVDTKFTGADGSIVFTLLVGGDSRISVYVMGKLAAVKTQFLDASPSQVTFNIGEYVSIFGYPIETGLFALASFILVLAVVFLFLARRRLTKAFGKKLER